FEELQKTIRRLEDARRQQERIFAEQGETIRKLENEKEELYSEVFQHEKLNTKLRSEVLDLKSQVAGVNLLNEQAKMLLKQREEAEKNLALSREECDKLKETCDGLHEELRMVDI